MTADEFVKIVRNGSEKLRVDEIVINTGSQELHGKGMLHIGRKKIEVEVTIRKDETNKGGNVPEVRTGIYTKRDRWTLAGLIEDIDKSNSRFPSARLRRWRNVRSPLENSRDWICRTLFRAGKRC